MASFRPKVSKHDRAIALIAVCIDNGWNTGTRIVGALKHLGLNPRHVAIVLKEGAGGNPEAHWWQRNADGHYSLHDVQPGLQPQV